MRKNRKICNTDVDSTIRHKTELKCSPSYCKQDFFLKIKNIPYVYVFWWFAFHCAESCASAAAESKP